ncbi:MAG: hypothetical protein J6J24_05015, partial [Clostridia bacterium]|nr:hypothetical protein [Clostridia bacterium]
MKKFKIVIVIIFMIASLFGGGVMMALNLPASNISSPESNPEEEVSAKGKWLDNRVKPKQREDGSYEIKSAENLGWAMWNSISKGFHGATYHLMNNVNLSGHYSSPFLCNSFYGHGYSIYGFSGGLLKYTYDYGKVRQYVGFLASGDVYDLSLSGSLDITLDTMYETVSVYIGGATGTGDAKNVETSISISINQDIKNLGFSSIVAGGVVGNGSATNCVSKGSLKLDKLCIYSYPTVSMEVGGIVGVGSATNCMSSCDIDVVDANYQLDDKKGSIYVGGISGSGKVLDCVFDGSVDVSAVDDLEKGDVGGIAGHSSEVKRCFNYGEVSVTDCVDINVGGVAGSSSDIANSANFADVYSSVASAPTAGYGGIVGNLNGSLWHSGNYALISTFVSSGEWVDTGGLVGHGNFIINRCVNYGAVSTGRAYAGHADSADKIYSSWDLGNCSYTYGYTEGSKPETDALYYRTAQWSNSSSVINSVTKNTYWTGIYSEYKQGGNWMVVPDGFCEFSELCEIDYKNWKYLILPMDVFRKTDVEIWWSKPSQTNKEETENTQADSTEIGYVRNAISKSVVTSMIFANGVDRKSSVDLYYNTSMFEYDQANDTIVTTGYVRETLGEFSLESNSFVKTNVAGDNFIYSETYSTKIVDATNPYVTTFMFMSKNYSNSIRVIFQLKSKAKKVSFSYYGEGVGTAVVVVPDGHSGRTADGEFYYKDTFHIKATPNLG